jgi:hypothetical protein
MHLQAHPSWFDHHMMMMMISGATAQTGLGIPYGFHDHF